MHQLSISVFCKEKFDVKGKGLDSLNENAKYPTAYREIVSSS